MKYYLVTITTEAAQEVPEIQQFNTEDEAKNAFYNMFVAKMAYESVKAVYCEILTSGGARIKQDIWSRQMPEPNESEGLI